jgi:DNA-binding response OmpR family regulator
MVMLRHPHPSANEPAAGSADRRDPPSAAGRLNVLLSSGDWQDETWADRLPLLLQPLDVHAIRVHSGDEASRVVRTTPIHIAVVDLALPLDAADRAGDEGGCRLLEILSRQPTPPPTVVVKRRKTLREDTREITRALSGGAFAVIERPVHLEIVLETLRRVLKRHYANTWPGRSDSRPRPDGPHLA